jgi:hypothetical protein
MQLLDSFSLVVASNLARLASLAPVRSHPAREYPRQIKSGRCRAGVHLAESAFPILATAGYCETVLKLRPEQGDQPANAHLDSEDLDCLIQHGGALNYPIVPWED